jgi:hypothetical protein
MVPNGAGVFLRHLERLGARRKTLRPNYSGNKRKREEAHRKKQEEKRNKRFNKSKMKNQPEAQTPTENVLPSPEVQPS